MANVYAQIRGSKRMLCFPPNDTTLLSFAPGASSSSVDVFSLLETTALSGTHPHEAMLSPGDVLLLPRLWLHTASPTTRTSVAVNVFFRDLSTGYSAGRDVYGNRDLDAYEKGRQSIARVAGAFKDLPSDAKEFYITRLAAELLEMASGMTD
jgi:tRNA wybutosine-synthesizing protein 4